MEQPIFLSYLFQGWRLEFRGDYFEAVNPATLERYRITLDPFSATPFRIALIDGGRSELVEQRGRR